MTIDYIKPCETKSLIHSSCGHFYPFKIPQQHKQLKNFISTKDPNIIYYASHHEIYALHVSTRKRKLIKSLPWQPVCLDAGYGWICVGGRENGRCAFISINESSDGPTTAFRQHAEVDELLPLDLDPEYRRTISDPSVVLQWPRPSHGSSYELQTHELGADIVNSITIHLLRSEKNCREDEVVAVLANNDQSVRIFSLTQSRLLETLEFPIAMNHASISPDGKLLLAVGDRHTAFFCKRVRLPSALSDGVSSYASYEWHEIAGLKLSLAESKDACFSTAFSPSGHICAVASQNGVITIFDTALIHDDMDAEEAVIDVLRSSRPSMSPIHTGAVRSMSFSPGPWDLLACCKTYLRNAFQSRQTIDLHTDSPGLIRAEIEEYDTTSEQRQLEIERRFVERHREALEAQDQLAAVIRTANNVELGAERRRIERDAAAAQASRERQLIDSIGLRRLQESNSVSSGNLPTAPIRVNYNPSSTGRTESREWSGIPSPSSNPQTRSSASIHDFIRQRERTRLNDRSYQPRRRSSVVMSNSNSSSNTSSPHTSSLTPDTATPTLSASPSRLSASTSDAIATNTPFNPTDPWQTITDAMSSADIPPDTLRSLQSRNLERRVQATAVQQATLDRPNELMMVEHADALEARGNRARDNVRSLRQMRAAHSRADVVYDEIDRELLLRRYQRSPRREAGLITMGIGWSEDGRNLFVATEEGILEYNVNIEGRKTFPGASFL
ncbi:hypothetical protein HO173_000777 [Letharia columbiana]|uniref:DUF2415 domain-containing protein n=1 Tax=Letharia columbiana TaxID=112416 RepID=A0A8H6G5K6_9LECA|nr:uncharacterized protein HO173_000777 [Letharia columbiana]KAF6240984.1 hypothetical protein HO173_000777 [Letharia columbiana]